MPNWRFFYQISPIFSHWNTTFIGKVRVYLDLSTHVRQHSFITIVLNLNTRLFLYLTNDTLLKRLSKINMSTWQDPSSSKYSHLLRPLGQKDLIVLILQDHVRCQANQARIVNCSTAILCIETATHTSVGVGQSNLICLPAAHYSTFLYISLTFITSFIFLALSFLTIYRFYV